MIIRKELVLSNDNSLYFLKYVCESAFALVYLKADLYLYLLCSHKYTATLTYR